MACYFPLEGWRSKDVNPATGKRSVVFNKAKGFEDLPMKIPCGQCTGCRLERSKQWAIRCYHESSMYVDNCFITLTYDNRNLPRAGSLVLQHFQLFMKRLRKEKGSGIRFFHCGEYGEKYGRPHYHALLFNFDFTDKLLFKETKSTKLYTSEELSALWPLGHASIGALTFQSAAYVARYIMKKVNGPNAADHYKYTDPTTGEVTQRTPEYITMSRGCKSLGTGGIGRSWMEKYKTDIWPGDFVVVDNKKMQPPRFYDTIYEKENPYEHNITRGERKIRGKANAENNTKQRLAVRRKVTEAKLGLLKRELE